MAVGLGKSKKFRSRWRGHYLIAKRFSDLNYQIQIRPGKRVTVNVNRMKRFHDPPRETKPKGKVLVGPQSDHCDGNWSNSDEEPLCLLGRPCQIPPFQNHEGAEIVEVTLTDQATQSCPVTPTAMPRQSQDDEERQGEILENPRDLGEVSPGATAQEGTQETADNRDGNVDPLEGEGQGLNESQPYPYSLRPLPGRPNYGSGKTTNK